MPHILPEASRQRREAASAGRGKGTPAGVPLLRAGDGDAGGRAGPIMVYKDAATFAAPRR